ncbi:hypothetical protein MHLP_03575 [Candidatus Mycoplasma haematolamae str. Purdue]|uniref:Uncharacterized protein n=1 Tax=Mycoplasma haematolamae (strain Purdue) TaxID=1212765 RepID=I7BAG8_MYCHA|nr:hypothetical protein [Candidatus Mycoplasma haematolamae]AFO52295.1 hypothetical protein MHLP_03575 [Candidatus Mycoplasma haematolamae str. Purdue]
MNFFVANLDCFLSLALTAVPLFFVIWLIYDYLVLGANDQRLKDKKGDDEKLWVLFIGAPKKLVSTTVKVGDTNKQIETFSSEDSVGSQTEGKEETKDWKFTNGVGMTEDCKGSENKYSYYKGDGKTGSGGLGWSSCPTDLARLINNIFYLLMRATIRLGWTAFARLRRAILPTFS